jgi:very-short-patch-repair endonuclease
MATDAQPNLDIRSQLVQTAQKEWLERLVDMSRRNNLLYYRNLQNGTLEISLPAAKLQQLLSGTALDVTPLILPHEQKKKQTVIKEIARKGLDNVEEKGVATLYLALGKASWPQTDGERPVEAPLLLIPITLRYPGQDFARAKMQASGNTEFNPVLLQFIKREYELEPDVEDLFRVAGILDTDDDEEAKGEHHLEALFAAVRLNFAVIPNLTVTDFAAIGNFSFQKLAMVKDLQDRLEELINNDVVAAIAGDIDARESLANARIEIDPRDLDKVPPKDEYAVTETDSSQQCAIAGVVSGQCTVIHGPPGTGKSQTITNLIATLAARGKRVLFVAEKRAALEVVKERLTNAGLDHLVIDLHGAESTPKKVLSRVNTTLSRISTSFDPGGEDLNSHYSDRRARLNEHAQRMHDVKLPTEMSIYQMQGAILQMPPEVTGALVRWRGEELQKLTPQAMHEIADLFHEAAGFETLLLQMEASPWAGVAFKDGEAVIQAIDLAVRLHQRLLPAFQQALARMLQPAGVSQPEIFADIKNLLADLVALDQMLDQYKVEAFMSGNRTLYQGLAPAQLGTFKALWHRISDADYRKAIKDAKALCLKHAPSPHTLYSELWQTSQLGKRWEEMTDGTTEPRKLPNLQEVQSLFAELEAGIGKMSSFKRLAHWPKGSIAQIAEEVAALAQDSSTPHRVFAASEVEKRIQKAGAMNVLEDLRMRKVPAFYWKEACKYAWLASTLDHLAMTDSQVHGFIGSTHSQYVKEFQLLDQQFLSIAAHRVRRAHAAHAVRMMNARPEEQRLIREQAAKSRRHYPLRRLFREAGEVLTAVCPCWMVSPLSVSQLIGAGSGFFDYVIFDEASQVLPEDAIPAILRAKHVVVAGDVNQLPPTPFFADSYSESDEDGEGKAVGYESLLSMAMPFMQGYYLNWHYRSKDERLIAYSNRNIYDERLVTFPGTGVQQAIRHELVTQLPKVDGQEESASAEVIKVVEMVLKHAEQRPDVSLGVITMGVKHAQRIQHHLDFMLASRPDLAEFFDTGKRERFILKSIESVQGDERDAIILSIGYGKNSTGSLPLHFGPILGVNGRRRLNVAVTRARESLTLVSSFAHYDIEASKVKPGTGLEFLKGYIEFASSGGTNLGRNDLTDAPVNDFETNVMEALALRGITCVPQLGSSNFRIDMAAQHPTEPGRFVLAIECDGASYHSSYTARDRDRLRQQHLERLGWKFHRIWSTDWFLRKSEEIERAVRAFNLAVKESESEQAPVYSNPQPQNVYGATAPVAPTRDERTMPLKPKSAISEYTNNELMMLIEWIGTDGQLRTDDQLVAEAFEQLPFKRMGSAIEQRIRQAIGAYRRKCATAR